MLFRLLTGKATISGVVLILLCVIANFTMRSVSRTEKKSDETMNRYAPAFNQLSMEALMDSSWQYSGPLGEFRLYFGKQGKLQMQSGDFGQSGSWSAKDHMLTFYFPGSQKPHLGFFQKSANELVGASPVGTPGTWKAKRLVEP